MTREEAKAFLYEYKMQTCGICLAPQEVGYCENQCKFSQAIDMAIEALSAEGVYGRPTTKDTLISREELNNALAQYVADGYAESADDYKAYCDIIDNLPNRLTEYDTFCGVDMEEAIKVMTKYNEEYNKQTEQTDKYPWEAIPCEEHYKLPGHDEVMNALDKLQIKYKTKEDEQVISKLNDSNCQHGRLIDADALMEKIYDSTYPLYSRQFEGYVIPMSRLEEIINNAPTVSARPHGEWIRNELWGMPFYRCSVCGFHGQKDFDFCPACGNEMIGESEDK